MPNNYILLERIELNASAASITFANIPQTGYTDLKVVASARNVGSAENNSIAINGLTTNFSLRGVGGDGSTTFSYSRTDNLNVFLSDGSSNTANTFSSVEIYFPNYLSSNYKSYSIDSLTENNATGATATLQAGLWSNTAAISSIAFNAGNGSGSFAQYSTFSLYGLAALGTTPAIAPKASGGNIIDYDGTYWIHTFLSSGTFTPQTGLTCEYLVVAGGGGGGGSRGTAYGASGGGGAGGYKTASGFFISSAATVTVGAGGTGGVASATVGAQGSSGSNSVFDTITSTGGGGGGSGDWSTGSAYNGLTGGSGGGAGSGGTKGTGTSGQGFDGAEDLTDDAGGGGGSSAVGSSPSSGNGGAGGAGTSSSISGSSVQYAGGGGGGSYGAGSGGTASFGGGAGGANAVNGTAGTANRGAGGGGSGGTSAYTPGLSGGAGGSGIVIIRYLAV